MATVEIIDIRASDEPDILADVVMEVTFDEGEGFKLDWLRIARVKSSSSKVLFVLPWEDMNDGLTLQEPLGFTSKLWQQICDTALAALNKWWAEVSLIPQTWEKLEPLTPGQLKGLVGMEIEIATPNLPKSWKQRPKGWKH